MKVAGEVEWVWGCWLGVVRGEELAEGDGALGGAAFCAACDFGGVDDFPLVAC